MGSDYRRGKTGTLYFPFDRGKLEAMRRTRRLVDPGYQFMRCNIVGTRLALGLLLGGNGMGHTEKPCIRGECLVRPCWRSTIIQAGEYQTG